MNDIDTRLRQLETQVRQYTNYTNNKTRSTFGFGNISEMLTPVRLYIGIPIIILLLLIIFRPNFCYTSETPTSKAKLSFQKIFLTWFILSLVLNLSLYAYFFKKND